MLKDFGTAGLLVIMVSSFFLAAWLGAALTGPGRPLHGFVTRRFRPLLLGLVAVHLALDQWERQGGAKAGMYLDLAVVYLLAMLFVPMLRRLQGRGRPQAGGAGGQGEG